MSEIRSAAFTVSDRAAPVVVAVNPADNERQVALNKVITVNFDEPLEANQNLSALLKVVEFSQTTPETGAYSLSADAKTISFTPTNLIADARYVISVNGQKDVFGNTQNQRFNSFFVTIDTTSPQISFFTINGKTAVNGMIVSTPRPSFLLRFSDELGIDTTATKLYLNKVGEPEQEVAAQVGNSDLRYIPADALETGRYKVKAVVKDYGGNQAADNEFEFEFAAQQPEILSVSPTYGPTSGNSIVTVTGSHLISGAETTDDSQHGLLGEYFECGYFGCPANVNLVRVDETVDVNAFNESIVPFINGYNEAVRWRGQIIPRYTETYNFAAKFNGGFLLKIDGAVVIARSSRSVTEFEGAINLEADRRYDIEIQNTNYYEYSVGGSFNSQHVAQLSWSSPSQAREIVPASQLRPAAKQTAPTVTIGGQPATVIGAIAGENDQISVILPPHAEGIVDVQVANENGSAVLTGGFEYYADTYPPSVRSFSPYNGTTNILPAKVSVTFDEPLAGGQNLAEILKVFKDSDNTPIAGQVTIDETFRRMQFVSSNPFEANTTYRIVVRGQTDTVGNVNNSDSISRFTVDSIPPTLILETPLTETLSLRPEIRVGLNDSFSVLDLNSRKFFVDGVDVTNITSLVYPCNYYFCYPRRDTYGLSYIPQTDLTLGTHIVRVQIADQAGNLADQTFNISIVADTQPPTVNQVYIADQPFVEGLRTAQRRPGFYMYFQDNGTLTAQSQKLFFGPQGGNLEQTVPTVYRNGQQWIMFGGPSQDLPFGFYSYRYELVDNSGNRTVQTLNFEVADLDITPPQVTAVNPESGAIQVNSNTNVTVTFSEPLDPNQNFADSVRILDGYYNAVSGTYQLDANSTNLTFTPSEPLAANSIYIIYAYGYLDLAGNGGQYFNSYFATADTIAPVVQTGQLYVDNENWVQLSGAETFDRQPTININYYDATTGIDGNSVVFTLDGQPVTDGVSAYQVYYRPETPLSYGQHTITVQAADLVGNTSELKTETFTVLRDTRSPFAVETDTTLLWHLDEADRYSLRLTPDAGDYRINGIFPYPESLTQQKSGQKPTETSALDPTPKGRFGGGVSYPNLTSISDSQIAALTNGGFTVEGWMKVALGGAGNPYTIWAKGNNSTKDFELLLTPAGNLKARIFNANGNAFEIEMPKETFDVTDNRWHSLAMTVEAVGNIPNQLTIYVDGQPRSTQPVSVGFGAIRNSGGEFYLGFRSYYDSYNSMFDEIRVSSTAHSAETVRMNYDSEDLGLVVTRHSPIVASDNTTEIIIEGYNLDTVADVSVTALDGSSLPVTTTITGALKTSLKANVTVGAAVPNGDVRLNVTNGITTVSRNLHVAAQRAFTADPETPLLFHLDESNGNPIVNSGTLGGFGESGNQIAGRFGDGRRFFTTAYNLQIQNIINSSFTGEFWVKTTAVSEETSLMTYGTDYDGSDVRIIDLVLTARGQLKAVLTDNNQVNWEAQTQIGEVNVFDNQWHLVSMTVVRNSQSDQNILKIYVDGTEKASSSMPVTFSSLNTVTSYRFYLNNFRYRTASAAFDDFRLLNYARTAAEIQNSWLGVNNLVRPEILSKEQNNPTINKNLKDFKVTVSNSAAPPEIKNTPTENAQSEKEKPDIKVKSGFDLPNKQVLPKEDAKDGKLQKQ